MRRSLMMKGVMLAVAIAAGMLAAQAQSAGNLVAAMALETASLDPINGNAPGTDRNIYNLYTENLLYQDSKGDFQPMLAESWEWAPDLKSITFKLRQNVKFQDGTPFDANAVKFNIDRVVSPEVNARARQYVVDIAGAAVVDPQTVTINLKRPSGSLLSILANEAGSMVSPTAVEKEGADFARHPVGTGPFKVISWSGGVVKAVKFDGYWGKDETGQQLPYLDEVSVRAIPNTSVKIVELRSGNVQLIDAVQVKDWETVEGDSNLALVPTIPGITQYITYNNQGEMLGKNIELRKALTYAIDSSAIEKVISRGKGVVQTAFEPPSSPVWSDQLKGNGFDLAKAKEALAKSGFTGQLTLSVIQRDPDTQIAQILQSMWKQAGINVRIEVIERTAFLEKVLRYDYDIALFRNVGPLPDPDMTFASFYGRNASQDFAGIKNQEIWDLVDEGRSLPDMTARKPIYVKIQQEILDNFWQAYLFWRPVPDAASVKLEGIDREFSGAWRYDKMKLAE